MEDIRYAVEHKIWDTVDASPLLILHIHTYPDDDRVHIRMYPMTGRRGFPLAWHRMVWSHMSSPRTNAFLFEESLADFATPAYNYDAVVGLIGGKKTSKIRVRFQNGEDDELVVPAGELQPVWRRITLFPSINFRTRDDAIPVTFELLSGPPPCVLIACMTPETRFATGIAHTINFPDGSPSIKWTGVQAQSTAGHLALPDLVKADGRAVRNRCAAITKELMEAVWHPRRVMHMGGVDALDGV